MKSSEALRKARQSIENTDSYYVCDALKAVGGGKTMVANNLNREHGRSGADHWLLKNSSEFRLWARNNYSSKISAAGIDHYEMNHDPEMINWRLRWIDWMIPQYEAVGD